MSPKKAEKVSAKAIRNSEPGSPHKAAGSPQSSSVHMQDTAQPPNVGPQQNLAGSTDDAEAQTSAPVFGVPQTPERADNNEDAGSPFLNLRQELGLSRVETPALRPRRDSDPFAIRLRPGATRDEATLHSAINDIVYNEFRVQTFMRLSLTPAEAASVRDRQAAQVLSQFMDDSLTLRDALWYLEYAGWDVELAILHQMHDHIDRTEAPDAGSPPSTSRFPEENMKLDREPARAGEAFNDAKFQIHYTQYGVGRTTTYPKWLEFDRNDKAQVRALNHWRWKTIMRKIGPPKPTKRKGNVYHPLEMLWLRNYQIHNPNLTGREIAKKFNDTFAGVMLPGELLPRPVRSLAAIACHRLRQEDQDGNAGGTRKRKRKSMRRSKEAEVAEVSVSGGVDGSASAGVDYDEGVAKDSVEAQLEEESQKEEREKEKNNKAKEKGKQRKKRKRDEDDADGDDDR